MVLDPSPPPLGEIQRVLECKRARVCARARARESAVCMCVLQRVYVCSSATQSDFTQCSWQMYIHTYINIYIYIYIQIYIIMWVSHTSPSPPQKSPKSAQKSAISPKKRPIYPQKCPILQTFPRHLNLPLFHLS